MDTKLICYDKFCILINNILPDIENYFSWIVNAAWVSIVCGAVYFGIDSICDIESFRFVKEMCHGFVKKREVR